MHSGHDHLSPVTCHQSVTALERSRSERYRVMAGLGWIEVLEHAFGASHQVCSAMQAQPWLD